MARRAGLLLDDAGLTFVAMTGRRGIELFTLEAQDNPGARLTAELEARRLRCGRVRVGLQRSLVTVKVLELPRIAGGQRREMLQFELERHLPFPAEDVAFDTLDLPQTPDGPTRLLLAAADRRVVDRALRILEEAKLKPASVTVACHNLPRLLRRRVGARRAVWVHRVGASTMLVFLADGQLQLSRSVPIESVEGLGEEIAATLPVLKWQDCQAVWISGDGASGLLSSSPGALGAEVISEPPYDAGLARVISGVPPEQQASAVLALAVAMGKRRPPLDLLPEGLRPHTVTVGQAVTAAMLVVTLGLGLAGLSVQGYKDRRYLRALEATTHTLEPQVKEVDRIAAELNQKKRLLAAVASAEQQGLRPLPLLRELTELLPQDAWLSALNLDLHGVELTGQANAASQLIPLLEGSPWLEHVEFTSPVTKGRDKEQFRLRAAWENGPAGPATAKPAGAAGRPGTEPPEVRGTPSLPVPHPPLRPPTPPRASQPPGRSS